MLLARAMRSYMLLLPGPPVIINTVLAKPASTKVRSICFASRRLKSYSLTPRALIAPGESAVWPTSSTTRKFAGAQLAPVDFGEELPGVSAHDAPSDSSDKTAAIDTIAMRR